MDRGKSQDTGLSDDNVKLIVGIIAAALLLFGPIEPYSLAFRTGYLIIVPALVWFILKYVGKGLDIDKAYNDRINRAILTLLAGAFLFAAYNLFTATTHFDCTERIRTHDGAECVGDYFEVEGNDAGGAFITGGIGVAILWYSVAKRENS